MLDCIVKVLPPSTINGWVKSSVVSLAVKALDLIAVILLFVIVTTGVPADVTKIDLIIIVSLTRASEEYEQRTFQSLVRDLDDVITKLNTSFQDEVKQEIEAKSFFLE